MSGRGAVKYLAALAVLTALARPGFSAGPANSSWPQYLATPPHASSSTVNGLTRPQLIWTVSTGGSGGIARGVSLDGNGDIYTTVSNSGSGNEQVIAYTAAGIQKWAPRNIGYDYHGQPAVSNDGQVFITTSAANGVTYAISLSTANGNILWGGSNEYQLCSSGLSSWGSPVLGPDGLIFYAARDSGGQSGGNFCVSAVYSTGTIKQSEISVVGQTSKTGALSPDGSQYYYLTNDGSLYAVNTNTLGQAWSASSINAQQVAVDEGGNVYVVRSSNLRKYNSSGAQQGTDASTPGIPSNIVPPVSGSRIYIATTATSGFDTITTIVALNTADLSPLWSFNVNNSLFGKYTSNVGTLGPMTLTGPPGGDTLYATFYNVPLGGTSARLILALNAATGEKEWFTITPANQVAGQIAPTSTPANRFYLYDNTQLMAFGESAASTFTVTATTTSLAPGESVTFTATVKDNSSVAVSSVSVLFEIISGTATPTAAFGLTNASGQFSATFSTSSLNSTVQESTFVVRAHCLDFTVDTSVFIEGEAIDHYSLSVPTQVAVGVPFTMEVYARNKYDHTLPTFPGTDGPIGVTLAPYLADTSVAGSGALGVTSVGISNGTGTVSSQTYNKTENIQIKATQNFPGTKTGTSSTITLVGPDHFKVNVPTAPVTAGAAFTLYIEAQDASNNKVAGYAGTVSLSALLAGNTAQAGTGTLGVNSANLSGGAATLTSQTYSKVETIKIKALDSSFNAVGVSTGSLQVTPGSAASLTLSANPGSLIQGQTSVLTAGVKDSFGNAISGSTVTFTVTSGSGTLAATTDGLAGAGSSAQAVSNSSGEASLFFGLPSGLASSQRNAVRAAVGSLTQDTTVYVSILVTTSGGVVVQSEDPRTKVTVPANAFGFNVKITIQDKDDLSASELGKISDAFARKLGKFIQTFVKKVQAFKQDDTEAGDAIEFVDLEFPYTPGDDGNVSVEGAPGSQPRYLRSPRVLVPQSVLRVYKLNETTSVWEEVTEGSFNVTDTASQVVKAKVKKVAGIYTLGAPTYKEVKRSESASFSTLLPSGSTATVSVEAATFEKDTILEVTFPSAADVPEVVSPVTGLKASKLFTEIRTSDNLQPLKPVKITLDYVAGDVTDLKESSLRLTRYDDDASVWNVIESDADTQNNRVTGLTRHLSLFGLAEAVAAPALGGAVVFPNPFRPASHTGITFSNLMPGTQIRIFTVSGRLLRELEADSTGQAAFDGASQDGEPLASGVYLVSLTAGTSQKTVKFAVER